MARNEEQNLSYDAKERVMTQEAEDVGEDEQKQVVVLSAQLGSYRRSKYRSLSLLLASRLSF